MTITELEKFYGAWSSKTSEEVEYDIAASMRKADVIANVFPRDVLPTIHTLLDFGCGYGGAASRLQANLNIPRVVGIDFSESAIAIANMKFGGSSLEFHGLETLDLAESLRLLESLVPDGVDCILLADVLEHVPDCHALVSGLAKFTKYFLVKLPVESSVFDNYVMPKEYPGPMHSNGHLREFDANNVYYFIRQLGLAPISETLYIYHIDDTFPPLFRGQPLRRKVVRWLLKSFKWAAARVLPSKMFLRLVGGGGYVCLATFNKDYILAP